jgi:biotin operon repressor
MAATVSQLVDLLADKLGIDIGTVRHVARNLREEGILPTGPRGGGQNTATIDERHAATLLVAVLGNAPTKAVEIDHAYRGAPLREWHKVEVIANRATGYSIPMPMSALPGDDLDAVAAVEDLNASLQTALAYFVRSRDLANGMADIAVGGDPTRPFAYVQFSIAHKGVARVVTDVSLRYAAPAADMNFVHCVGDRAQFLGFAPGHVLSDISDLLGIPPEGLGTKLLETEATPAISVAQRNAILTGVL